MIKNLKITRKDIYEAIISFKEKVNERRYNEFNDVDFLLLETCLIYNSWTNTVLSCFNIENGKKTCTIFYEDDTCEDIEILNLDSLLEDYQINLPSTKGAIEFVEIELGMREDFSPDVSDLLGYYGML